MSTTIKASELKVGMELEYLGGWHEIMDIFPFDMKDADEGLFPVVVVQLRDMDLGKLPWFYRSIPAEKDVMVRCGYRPDRITHGAPQARVPAACLLIGQHKGHCHSTADRAVEVNRGSW